ncbi:MAG: type II toxin-antitoxin system VapC family toxin [Fimbriimonadales bacterium]
MLHLDTSIVVAYLRGSAVVARMLSRHRDEVSMSSIVLAELVYGALASSRPDANLTSLGKLHAIIPVVDFDRDAAEAYGRLRITLRKKGLPTGETDAFIAATAIAHRATLVTHNVKHFDRIEALTVVDWLVG